MRANLLLLAVCMGCASLPDSHGDRNQPNEVCGGRTYPSQGYGRSRTLLDAMEEKAAYLDREVSLVDQLEAQGQTEGVDTYDAATLQTASTMLELLALCLCYGEQEQGVLESCDELRDILRNFETP